MRRRFMMFSIGTCVFASAASAQFDGIRIVDVTDVLIGGTYFGADQALVDDAWNNLPAQTGPSVTPHRIYRVYADFLSPTDFLDSVVTVDPAQPLSIAISAPAYNVHIAGVFPDNLGALAPLSPLFSEVNNAAFAFDSFVTIGIDGVASTDPLDHPVVYVGGEQNTTQGPGGPHSLLSLFNPPYFGPPDIYATEGWGAGLYEDIGNEAWYALDPIATGTAVPGGPSGFEVMLAQITIPTGATIDGYFSGFWGDGSFNRGDGEYELSAFGGSFLIPAPGTALPLILICAVCTRRRRFEHKGSPEPRAARMSREDI